MPAVGEEWVLPALSLICTPTKVCRTTHICPDCRVFAFENALPRYQEIRRLNLKLGVSSSKAIISLSKTLELCMLKSACSLFSCRSLKTDIHLDSFKGSCLGFFFFFWRSRSSLHRSWFEGKQLCVLVLIRVADQVDQVSMDQL